MAEKQTLAIGNAFMEENISADDLVKGLNGKLPKFSDGRINYSGSKIAAVVTVYIFNEGKLLILKRSEKVGHYKSMWDTVSGYLDEVIDPVDKALREVNEELGIGSSSIEKASKGKEFSFLDNKEGVEWVIVPILVVLSKKPKLKLNFENTEYKWIDPKSLSNYNTVPGLEIGLGNIPRLV